VAYKGKFKPVNPEKYRGDPGNVVYRSSYEFKFFRVLDMHPDVEWWQSEEFSIPYVSPIDGKVHRYFPDVLVSYRKQNSNESTIVLIEIKPNSQTKTPDISKKNNTPSGRVSRRYLNEVKTYGINTAKWEAAKKYCDERGWQWRIMTEKELGIK
jgi:hypothetical protein